MRERILRYAESYAQAKPIWGDEGGSVDAVLCRKATRQALAEIRAAQAVGTTDAQLCRHFQRRERALRHELSELDDRLVVQVAMLLSSDAATVSASCLHSMASIMRDRSRLEETLLALQTLVAQLGGLECRNSAMQVSAERLLRQCTRCLQKDGAA